MLRQPTGRPTTCWTAPRRWRPPRRFGRSTLSHRTRGQRATKAANRTANDAPWLAHIARHCELVLDDRRYLLHHLAAGSDAEAMRLAHRYIEAWAAAAYAEPQAHRRANVGRRAANAMLRGATP